MRCWRRASATGARLTLRPLSRFSGVSSSRSFGFKRVESRVDVELLNIPRSYVDKYDELIGRVTREQANDATRARISPRDLTIVVVATASEVAPAFERLPGVRSLEVVPFDRN